MASTLTLTSNAAATSRSLIAPRIMIITDHADFGRALEHHIEIIWPQGECRIHAPMQAGRLHRAFTAVGYDAVLLDDQVECGCGREWLENLMHRPDFPPVMYFAPRGDPALAAQVIERGAIDCLVRERIDHRRMADALREAVLRRRQHLALLRTGPQAEQLCRFGPITIRGHRFVRELAVGGMSMVYLAESERAGEIVVLKVLRETHEADSHEQFARFLQEYELISKIRHPNVVRIFDLGIADDHAYIAMEYFPRGDLRGQIARGLQREEAVPTLAQIAGALQVVHEIGVLHRDLKPGNVMLRSDGSLAIIDFGLAKPIEMRAEASRLGEIFGTPYYMSPEQGRGDELDVRSDLYSLGVIFYEMLTRKKPYTASTPLGVVYLHANAPIPRLEEPVSIYQPLLDRLLAKDRTDRFTSARELLDALKPYLNAA
ncbi:MAG TPA: serine/threonine-protein kinase [Steroidobacter sp.]|jgi:tRNA A-37 threonylcarbamoyl transferase component Bud32|nr:serine/threonine-protein kinase [Steroidobacter sp.]